MKTNKKLVTKTTDGAPPMKLRTVPKKTDAEQTPPPAAPPPADGPETTAPVKGNVVPAEYRAQYGKDGNCGDKLATTFQAHLDAIGDAAAKRAEVFKIAEANGLTDAVDKYGSKNTGMVRMNVGNRLRGMERNGYSVVIGDVVIEGNPIARAERIQAEADRIAKVAAKAEAKAAKEKKAEATLDTESLVKAKPKAPAKGKAKAKKLNAPKVD